MGLDILLFLLLPVVISVPIAWLLASAQCGESDRAFRAKMRARRIAELEAAVRPWEVWDYEAEYARQHAAQVAEAERLRGIIDALQPGMLLFERGSTHGTGFTAGVRGCPGGLVAHHDALPEQDGP